MHIEDAPDVKERITRVVKGTGMGHVNCERLICFRSRGSKGYAITQI